jgi:hypothetical protein
MYDGTKSLDDDMLLLLLLLLLCCTLPCSWPPLGVLLLH